MPPLREELCKNKHWLAHAIKSKVLLKQICAQHRNGSQWKDIACLASSCFCSNHSPTSPLASLPAPLSEKNPTLTQWNGWSTEIQKNRWQMHNISLSAKFSTAFSIFCASGYWKRQTRWEMRIDGKEFDWKQSGGRSGGKSGGRSLETQERPSKVQAASWLKIQQTQTLAVKRI